MNLAECRRIFNLNGHYSLENIKTIYKDLALTWHPDRFPPDPELQSAAEEKMKAINRAYETLSAHLQTTRDDPQDRRCYPRTPCSLAVFHTGPNHACSSLSDRIENISAAGLFLQTRANYKPGQHLRLNFTLPRFGELIGMSGKVVHSAPVGVGIKFQISNTYRNFLAAFVAP